MQYLEYNMFVQSMTTAQVKMKMKLTKEVIEKINNVPTRRRIGEALEIGDAMLYRHINTNKVNGRLTKIDALQVIALEVGVDDIMEIVEHD